MIFLEDMKDSFITNGQNLLFDIDINIFCYNGLNSLLSDIDICDHSSSLPLQDVHELQSSVSIY